MSDSLARHKRPTSTRPQASKHDIDYLLNGNASRALQSSSPTATPMEYPPSQPLSLGVRSIVVGDGARPRTTGIVQDATKRKSKDRPHECEICGFSFGQRSDCNKHIRTVHYGERPFTCQYCNQNFGEKGNLNKHIRALHEKARPFKCTECKAEFPFRDGLSRHISMVHHEVRPFKCAAPECTSTFKQKAHAEKHYTSVHKKHKPCVCFCGAAFRENYNMKQHQRTVHNMDPK